MPFKFKKEESIEPKLVFEEDPNDHVIVEREPRDIFEPIIVAPAVFDDYDLYRDLPIPNRQEVLDRIIRRGLREARIRCFCTPRTANKIALAIRAKQITKAPRRSPRLICAEQLNYKKFF